MLLHPSLRTIDLDSRGVDAAIDALSSAVKSFSLKPRQRMIYRTLMATVDFGAVALLLPWLLYLVNTCSAAWHFGTGDGWRDVKTFLASATALLLAGSLLSGMLVSLFAWPLFRLVWRERSRLKSLGLDSLSTTLWKASRKNPAWSSLRGVVLALLGVVYTGGAFYNLFGWVAQKDSLSLVAVPLCVWVGILFLGAGLLRDQKEQLELASQAVELKKALQSLRHGVGANGMVAVPADIVERAAMIECVQVAKDREIAILGNAGKQSLGYAIVYLPEPLAQRAHLTEEDRLELEDLLVRLSAAGNAPNAQSAQDVQGESMSVVQLATAGVEVAYTIEETARTITIRRITHKNAEQRETGQVSGA